LVKHHENIYINLNKNKKTAKETGFSLSTNGYIENILKQVNAPVF
jgi:hypothetical protein